MTIYTDFSAVPDNTYEVLYADCPWKYYGDPNKDQAAGKHYVCMTESELTALPVRSKCGKRAVLFMWATGPMVARAIRVMETWGFHYRCIGFFWLKTTKTGKIIRGQGVRPSFVKQLGEVVLIGSTNPKGRTFPVLDESMGQDVQAPRGRHSEKPVEVRRRIETLFGPKVSLELFARGGPVPGWDRFGNDLHEPSTTLEGLIAL
jgi:N6-adenosine-specific RNA methylase IME4